MSNLRAAYAEVMAEYLSNGAILDDEHPCTAKVTARQTQANWQNAANGTLLVRVNGEEAKVTVPAKVNGAEWTITIDPTLAELIKVS